MKKSAISQTSNDNATAFHYAACKSQDLKGSNWLANDEPLFSWRTNGNLEDIAESC